MTTKTDEMEFKSQILDGIEVLFIKWQDDEQMPAIRMMTYVAGVYAESTLGFDDFFKRNECYDNRAELAARGLISAAKSVTSEKEKP